MRKIYLYSTLLIILNLGACEDWLNLIPPDGLVQEEYWQTKEDIEAVLMGAYYQFNQIDEKLFIYGEIRGDLIARDNDMENYIKNIMEGNIYPNNNLCDWSEFYKIINYCNFVLKYNPVIHDLDQTYSEYKMKGIETEAKFLRGLSYFYLVRLFKDVPFILSPTESDDIELFLPKTDGEEILESIKADLLEARKYVTDDYGSLENNIGRVSKNAINSLLADISLWNFEYEDCISYIEEIEKSEIMLVPSGQWYSIFYPGNSLEGIFELQFDANLDQNNTLYKRTYTEENYLASTTTTELLSPIFAKEIVRGDGTYRGTDYKIWKYCGSSADGRTLRPSSEQSSANWILYRYADILLMKAEALSQINRFDEAIDYLNMIRERANVEPLSAPQTPEAFEDIILEERAKEFAFEGKRWFDLLRMGRRNDYARKHKLIAILIKNVPANQRLVLASKLTDPLGWYLPIEDKELERNKNLVQNPYYEGY